MTMKSWPNFHFILCNKARLLPTDIKHMLEEQYFNFSTSFVYIIGGKQKKSMRKDIMVHYVKK